MTTTATDTLPAALAEFRSAARKLLAVAEGRYDELEHEFNLRWPEGNLAWIARTEKQMERADEIAQVARDAVAGMEDL